MTKEGFDGYVNQLRMMRELMYCPSCNTRLKDHLDKCACGWKRIPNNAEASVKERG